MTRAVEKLASPGAFRLILALAVFLHHSTGFNIGMSAVLIFFVLSGYWVATMWAHTYAHTRTPYLTYLISRVWRITPVFAETYDDLATRIRAAGQPVRVRTELGKVLQGVAREGRVVEVAL